MSIKVETMTVCDVTGADLRNLGWAIVRRKDGVEVAHFQVLEQLDTEGDTLRAACWRGATEADQIARQLEEKEEWEAELQS